MRGSNIYFPIFFRPIAGLPSQKTPAPPLRDDLVESLILIILLCLILQVATITILILRQYCNNYRMQVGLVQPEQRVRRASEVLMVALATRVDPEW